ncbi:MAG: hypothetical protein IIB57_14790 [Planctomycetes bacterium]|nr:hypothetical protein [Planctomycetota bacterium]
MWHSCDYPPIPTGSSVEAVSPWNITGGRIPCTLIGFVTADITIRCDGKEGILEDYQLFEVIDPG